MLFWSKKTSRAKLIKGTDEVVRGAEVVTKQNAKMKKSILKRPVNKLVPLEMRRPRRQAALNGEIIRRLNSN